MNKFDLAPYLTVFILSAGLISCAPDKKERDDYRAPAPVIQTSNGHHDLRTWDRRTDKTLDLYDSVDVSAGRPTLVEVVSTCNKDQVSFTGNFTFNGRQPLKIFQILPEDLLSEDLARTTCSFEVRLFNAIGSQHIYQLKNAPIADAGLAGVTLEDPADPHKTPMKLHSQKLGGIKARAANSGQAEISLNCKDAKIEPLPFNQVIELSNFNFRKPLIKEGRAPEAVMQSPLQTCRIVVMQDGHIQNISKLIEIQMPREPLVIRVQPDRLPSQTQILNWSPYPYAELTIHNPDKATRWMRIPQKAINVSLGVVVSPPPGSGAGNVFAELTSPWLQLVPESQLPVQQEDGASYFQLQARQSLRIKIVAQPRPFSCRAPGAGIWFSWTDGYLVTPTEALIADELSETGELLTRNEIKIQERSMQLNYGDQTQQSLSHLPRQANCAFF